MSYDTLFDDLAIMDHPDEVRDLEARTYKESYEEFVKAFWDEVPGTEPLQWNWHMSVICRELEVLAQGVFQGLNRDHDTIVNISPGTSKSSLISILYPTWIWANMPNARILSASHTDDLVIDLANKSRYVIKSKRYQELFPHVQIRPDQDSKGYYANTCGGDRYTCTVAGKSPMGFHAHFLICDDPIDPKKAVSEVELKTAKDFFDNVFPSRKVNKQVSVTILVMQRLHEEDPTGHWLKKSKRQGAAKLTHIKLPAELDKNEDGTYSDKNVNPPELADNYVDGLMDPVRLPLSVLNERKTDGIYAFCTPGFTPILMSDWTEKPIKDVEVGDEVVGYTLGKKYVSGKHQGRADCSAIVKSVVLKKYEYLRPVVLMTMESGREVYCTPDHKWWTRRKPGKENRKAYAEAKVGSKLFSVYDPVPVPNREQQRLWDWLGGIIDGEASCKYHIAITQSPEHNPEVFGEIKRVLNELGLEHSCKVFDRKVYTRRKRDSADKYVTMEKESGYFYLNGGRSTKFRLLNSARLAKRQQIIDSIWNKPNKVSDKTDRVKSIKSVGVMKVYGLTTTSGNYVAWGYASQNSGQYLQNPVPVGGGMFKSTYFAQRIKAAPYHADRVFYIDRACLVPGTLIYLQGGVTKPIEQVQAGDTVMDRMNLPRRVNKAWRTKIVNQVVSVLFQNGCIVTGTEDHRVWTENRGWTNLIDLQPSDTVLSCTEGSMAWDTRSPITFPMFILKRDFPEGIPVYDLEVEDAHEFFANGILVHNSTEDGGCYTAGVLLARDKDNRLFVEWVMHGQWEPYERNQRILAAARRFRSRYGPRNEPTIHIEREGGASGKGDFQDIARLLMGFNVVEHNITGMGKKEFRAGPWSGQLAASNVWLVDNGESEGHGASDWDIENYIQEHILFPKGKYKDQVDASSGALIVLSEERPAVGMRVLSTRGDRNKELRIYTTDRKELCETIIEEPSLFISLSDHFPLGNAELPPHAIQILVDSLVLQFSDIQPEDKQDDWNEIVHPYELEPEKLIMTRDHAKKLWAFITKKRSTQATAIVIQDDLDRRAISMAMGIAEILGKKPESTVFSLARADIGVGKKVAPNSHVYQMTKTGRSLVV